MVRHLWSLNVSGIPHYTDLYPSRNINPKSWFILSVLFFTGGETSLVPTHVRDLRHTYLHPDRNFYLTSQFILSMLSLHMSGIPITWIYNLVGTSTGPAGSFSLCSFWQAVRCHTDLHPGRNVYQPAGSFCPCCFWQVVRHLWSLHVSGIPRHVDLHPIRNAYLTGCFILSL